MNLALLALALPLSLLAEPCGDDAGYHLRYFQTHVDVILGDPVRPPFLSVLLDKRIAIMYDDTPLRRSVYVTEMGAFKFTDKAHPGLAKTIDDGIGAAVEAIIDYTIACASDWRLHNWRELLSSKEPPRQSKPDIMERK
jgi:hypothetical protein